MPIKTFLGQESDNELINLIPFLIWLSKKPDVRPVCDLYTEYSLTHALSKKVTTIDKTVASTHADLEGDTSDEPLTDRRRDQPEMYYAKSEEQQHNRNTRKMECVFFKESKTPTTPRTKNKVFMRPELLKTIRSSKLVSS